MFFGLRHRADAEVSGVTAALIKVRKELLGTGLFIQSMFAVYGYVRLITTV